MCFSYNVGMYTITPKSIDIFAPLRVPNRIIVLLAIFIVFIGHESIPQQGIKLLYKKL